jgi:GNAT superfamily N-acetyltransferase
VLLEQARYDTGLGADLVGEIQAEMAVRYGGADATPVRPEQFDPPHGAFLIAFVGGAVVGCVALRRLSGTDVELKRMYVRPAHRRRGHGRRLLAAAEDAARARGYRRLLLETGTAQPEAMALYEAADYVRVHNFGHYADSPLSRAYAKVLR